MPGVAPIQLTSFKVEWWTPNKNNQVVERMTLYEARRFAKEQGLKEYRIVKHTIRREVIDVVPATKKDPKP